MSGIAAKSIDFIFRTFYSKQLGSEGLALFSLCFGVHGIMLNIATGGLGVAVSKIVSEKISQRAFGDIKKTMRLAITTVTVMGALVVAAACIFSREIAVHFLHEPRTRMCLVYLSPSIVFMGISYCLKGYFYASRKIWPPATSEFLEQGVKIATITFLLVKMLPMGIEHGCEGIFMGITIGEFSSCTYLSSIYIFQSRDFQEKTQSKPSKLFASMARIALPVTANSLTGSFLRMQEQVFVVEALKRSGQTHVNALKLYGGIYGMVMPLIVFPLTLLSSCFTMLVPEISRAYSMKSSTRLKTLVSRIYRFCSFFGFLILVLLFTFSDQLSVMVYNSHEISSTLRVLSLLTPLMFMDSVSCGILNGMGKQPQIFLYSILDSLIRIALIFVLIPIWGINALLLIVIISNIFTCCLTTRKAHMSACIHFGWNECFLKWAVVSFATWFVADSLISPWLNFGYVGTSVGILISASVYFFMAITMKSPFREDFLWLKSRIPSN